MMPLLLPTAAALHAAPAAEDAAALYDALAAEDEASFHAHAAPDSAHCFPMLPLLLSRGC